MTGGVEESAHRLAAFVHSLCTTFGDRVGRRPGFFGVENFRIGGDATEGGKGRGRNVVMMSSLVRRRAAPEPDKQSHRRAGRRRGAIGLKVITHAPREVGRRCRSKKLWRRLTTM